MIREELVMDSEKEETLTTAQNAENQVQHEEIIPGSSPEGVFPNDEMFVPQEQQEVVPHRVPLQVEGLKHEEEVVEEGHEGVIDHGEPLGDLIVDDGDQQYQEGPQLVITQEDMYEAGYDVDDLNQLTEEQLNHVVAISQQRQAKQNEQEAEQGDLIHYEDAANGEGGDYGHGQAENTVQILLTNEGGVNITDSKQRQFYISPTEVANLNIDLNNFGDENIQQLIQFALPTIKASDEKHASSSAYSREVLDQQPSTSYHQHHHEHEETERIPEDIRSPMIGETVQIRTADGRLQEAVVKYVRGNSEFKIQFMDGEFAYATMDQMLLPHRPNESSYAGAPLLIRRTEMARLAGQKRAAAAVAASSEDLMPPVLKRSFLAPVVDGPHVAHQPNFCCPICDKKVFQKEPSYIVIRLPACDSCTREKIIVLDEQNNS